MSEEREHVLHGRLELQPGHMRTVVDMIEGNIDGELWDLKNLVLEKEFDAAYELSVRIDSAQDIAIYYDEQIVGLKRESEQ